MILADYTALVTHQHAKATRFMDTLAVFGNQAVQFMDDLDAYIENIDIDTGTGNGLDIIGEYVDRDRALIPGSPIDDELYRLVLRAKIISNTWDGSLPQLYTMWETVFPTLKLAIQEWGLLQIAVALLVEAPTQDEKNILRDGQILPKPSGVRMVFIMVLPSDGEMFAWDLDNEYFSGWETGQWGEEIQSA